MASQPILASASYDQTVKLWNVATAQCLHSMAHNESQVNALSLTPSGERAAAAGYQYVRMYDTHEGKSITSYEANGKNVTAVGFLHSGQWMYTAGEDCTVKLFDLRQPAIVCAKIFQVLSCVNTICLHPNEVELFVGDALGTLWVWHLRNDGNMQMSLEPMGTPISLVHACIDEDATKLAAVTNKGTVYTWSLVGSARQQSIPQLLTPTPSTDASKLNDTSMESIVHDLALAQLEEHNRTGGTADLIVNTAASSSSSTHTAQPAPFVQTKLVPKKKLKVHSTYATRCAFSPDSTLLVTTSADHTARVWKTADLSELSVLQLGNSQPLPSITSPTVGATPASTEVLSTQSQKWVWDCAFTADSQNVFTCSSDHMLRLWDVNGGKPLRTYQGHKGPVTSLAFRDMPAVY